MSKLQQVIPERLRWPIAVGSVLFPLLVWLVVTGSGVVSPVFLPSPGSVARAMGRLASSGELWADTRATLVRVALGFGIVVVISVPLGVAMGTWPAARALFEPMIGLVRYMPAPAFIPLLIIWLGLGEPSKIALLVIGTVFFNTLMSADAAAQVPEELVNVTYTLGASRGEVVRKVIVPFALPGLVDAMRVNIAATWNLVVVAELIAAQQGLGYRIVRAQRGNHTDTIFAVLIVIGVIGVLMDLGFRVLRNKLSPWAR
ncbi:MAG: NitT/TauT family transport system permease protein [Actinomycetota bacterium]|nr:NitT/TauT family transport system permease protein [Actinomycetota bacterium]